MPDPKPAAVEEVPALHAALAGGGHGARVGRGAGRGRGRGGGCDVRVGLGRVGLGRASRVAGRLGRHASLGPRPRHASPLQHAARHATQLS